MSEEQQRYHEHKSRPVPGKVSEIHEAPRTRTDSLITDKIRSSTRPGALDVAPATIVRIRQDVGLNCPPDPVAVHPPKRAAFRSSPPLFAPRKVIRSPLPGVEKGKRGRGRRIRSSLPPSLEIDELPIV
jgi:hypothetical protein